MNINMPPLQPYKVPMTGTRTYSQEPEKGLVWDESLGAYRIASKDLQGLPIVRKRPMPFWKKLALILLGVAAGLAAIVGLVYVMVHQFVPGQVVQSQPAKALSVVEAPAPVPVEPIVKPVVQVPVPAPAVATAATPAPAASAAPVAAPAATAPAPVVVAAVPAQIAASAARPVEVAKPPAPTAKTVAPAVATQAKPASAVATVAKPAAPVQQAVPAKSVSPAPVAQKPAVGVATIPTKPTAASVASNQPVAAPKPVAAAPATQATQVKPVEVVTPASLQRGWPIAVENGGIKYFDGAATKIYRVGEVLPNGEKIVDVDEGSATFATDKGVRQIRSSKLNNKGMNP